MTYYLISFANQEIYEKALYIISEVPKIRWLYPKELQISLQIEHLNALNEAKIEHTIIEQKNLDGRTMVEELLEINNMPSDSTLAKDIYVKASVGFAPYGPPPRAIVEIAKKLNGRSMPLGEVIKAIQHAVRHFISPWKVSVGKGSIQFCWPSGFGLHTITVIRF